MSKESGKSPNNFGGKAIRIVEILAGIVTILSGIGFGSWFNDKRFWLLLAVLLFAFASWLAWKLVSHRRRPIKDLLPETITTQDILAGIESEHADEAQTRSATPKKPSEIPLPIEVVYPRGPMTENGFIRKTEVFTHRIRWRRATIVDLKLLPSVRRSGRDINPACFALYNKLV